uniref:Uncharacterized protein n=1 Tax=Oryza barthii TaxID=65489 RepID=A0A0D3EN36_9ORYZ
MFKSGSVHPLRSRSEQASASPRLGFKEMGVTLQPLGSCSDMEIANFLSSFDVYDDRTTENSLNQEEVAWLAREAEEEHARLEEERKRREEEERMRRDLAHAGCASHNRMLQTRVDNTNVFVTPQQNKVASPCTIIDAAPANFRPILNKVKTMIAAIVPPRKLEAAIGLRNLRLRHRPRPVSH